MSKSKITILIAIILVTLSSSWQPNDQNRRGEIIFKGNCASCHKENETTYRGPSFQNIRKDYGVEWSVTFVKKPEQLIKQKNLNALYTLAVFYPIRHMRFPVLEEEALIAVFDYVDSFKYDSTQTRHRRVPDSEKQKLVNKFDQKIQKAWFPQTYR